MELVQSIKTTASFTGREALLSDIQLDAALTDTDCQPSLLNPSMGTLKPQSNGPLSSNTLIGTLAVDRWAATFDTAKRGLGQSPHRCTKCNSPPINGQCTNFTLVHNNNNNNNNKKVNLYSAFFCKRTPNALRVLA